MPEKNAFTGTEGYEGVSASYEEYIDRLIEAGTDRDHERYFEIEQPAYIDGNIYLKNGFHSVILGVGMYKIHTIEEYLVISDMEKTAEAVLEFITK